MRDTPRKFLCVAGLCLCLVPGQSTAQPAGKPETPPARVRTVPLSGILTIGKANLTIGVEDEEGPYLFGTIFGMALDSEGFLYVPEYPEGTIKVFDPAGRHRMTFGGRGRGPGEFINPVSLLHDGDSTLFAAQGEFGITEMTAKGGRIALRRVFGVGSRFRSLCAMGDTLVAAGWVGGSMIHFLGRDGSPARSFGAGWSVDTIERVRETANRAAGSLTCDEASGRIVLTQHGGPQLRAYGRDGTLAWEATLPSFRHWFYVAAPGNGVTMVAGDDFVEPPVLLPRDRLLVQVGRVDHSKAPRRRSPTAVIFPPVVRRQAYVLDARTGSILSRSDASESLGTVRDTVSFLLDNDPFPRLIRRTITFGRSSAPAPATAPSSVRPSPSAQPATPPGPSRSSRPRSTATAGARNRTR